MAKNLSFKDFMVVDYRPGEPEEIKYRDLRQRRTTMGGGPVSEKEKKKKPYQHPDPLSTGKHAKNIGMGWPGKHTTVKDPTSSRHTHVFQYTEANQDDEQAIHKMLNSQPAEKLLKAYKKLYKREYPGTSKSELVSKIKSKIRNYNQAYELIKEEIDLNEVSQALGHKVAKARQAQASDLRQKAVDEPDMMKAFAHTKAANKAEKKAGQSYNRLMKKEEVELEEKAYVSSLSPELGRKGSHDVIGKDGKVVKSYPYTKDGMKAAQTHLSKMKEEVELDEEMTAAHKKLAHDVHKQLKRDEPMGLAAGMKLKANHKTLRSKYGADWRKKAGINEEAELDEYNTKSSKAIVRKDNKPIAIYPDLKSAQKDYHGKGGYDIGMRSHSAAMRIKKENPGIKIVESVEDDVDEALNVTQRLAKSRQMKRMKAKLTLGRKRAAKRIASQEKLMLRARRKAREFILKRLTKDIPKSELTFARRQELEKRLDKMKGRIEKIAKRLLPKVRKAELDKKRGGGKKD